MEFFKFFLLMFGEIMMKVTGFLVIVAMSTVLLRLIVNKWFGCKLSYKDLMIVELRLFIVTFLAYVSALFVGASMPQSNFHVFSDISIAVFLLLISVLMGVSIKNKENQRIGFVKGLGATLATRSLMFGIYFVFWATLGKIAIAYSLV